MKRSQQSVTKRYMVLLLLQWLRQIG